MELLLSIYLAIMANLSILGDGELQIAELVDNVHVLISNSLNTSDIIEAFRILDYNGTGYIR